MEYAQKRRELAKEALAFMRSKGFDTDELTLVLYVKDGTYHYSKRCAGTEQPTFIAFEESLDASACFCNSELEVNAHSATSILGNLRIIIDLYKALDEAEREPSITNVLDAYMSFKTIQGRPLKDATLRRWAMEALRTTRVEILEVVERERQTLRVQLEDLLFRRMHNLDIVTNDTEEGTEELYEQAASDMLETLRSSQATILVENTHGMSYIRGGNYSREVNALMRNLYDIDEDWLELPFLYRGMIEVENFAVTRGAIDKKTLETMEVLEREAGLYRDHQQAYQAAIEL